MNVLITTQCYLMGYSQACYPGEIRQIAREYYNEQTMTRLGTNLTSGQQAALIPWSTVSATWTAPIYAE